MDRSLGELLGIDIESGERRVYRTVAGSFPAYGHEITLNTRGLQWNAQVYFYAAGDPDQNFLGRRGWLDRIRLGVIHYDQVLYLAPYDQ